MLKTGRQLGLIILQRSKPLTRSDTIYKDVSVYKDANERAKSAPQLIPCPSIDKFKYAYSVGDETDSNLIALAYAKIKTESVLDGASNV